MRHLLLVKELWKYVDGSEGEAQMKELTDNLASVGAPISEEDQVVTLRGSLPPKLVTALEAHVDDLCIEFVQQSLIHEEQKQGVTVSQADSALQRKYRSHKPPARWNCDEVHHIQHFCPKSRSQHKAKAAEENPTSEDLFTASDDLPRMEKWLVDLGASSHLSMLSESKRARLINVLYVPKLACNLFSVRAAASTGKTVKCGRTR